MRVRLLAIVSALALFVLGAVPASAASEGHDYLALGDSVPFGFNPLVNPNDATNFVGYPEIVAQRLDIKDVNAACSGEATGGLRYLTGHRDTRLITLTLGANDLFRWQKDCAVSPTTGTCPLGLSGVFATMQANLTTIFSTIRATGYSGLIVAVTYYALDYSDAVGVFLSLKGAALTT